MKTGFLLAVAFLALGCAGAGHAQGFKFSQEDNSGKAKEEARQQAIAERLSTPCRDQLKDKKIMLIIGEQQSGGGIQANQDNYGPHFQVINQRLRALGLKTYTPEEIKKQIAQAEIDAYFKGNPDAALSASRRLGASFVLRGLITAQASVNPVIRVNEVTVNMGFSLADSSGSIIADAGAQGGVFSGSDVRSAAARLINERADEVVSKLYSDYCNNAQISEPKAGRSDANRKK
ncbi:MAG: hypothetical protein K8S22_15940 [Betaproteobacteria bacterium]|nr:hypothetical protein [Betaproteobacteria bacterium]